MPAGPFGKQTFGKGVVRPIVGKGTPPTFSKGSVQPTFGKGNFGMKGTEDLRLGRLAHKGIAHGGFASSFKGAAAAAGKGKEGTVQGKTAAVLGSDVSARSQLNTFLQRHLGRPVTKEDQEVSVVRVDEHQFQATLTLHCLGDEMFVGEVAATQKEAAELVAVVALNHHGRDSQAMPPSEKKKRKPVSEKGEPQASSMTKKSELNSVCMKLLRRPVTKGEITYETSRAEDATYQSVVSIQQVQDEGGGSEWTGEVCGTKQDAEHSAD